ncbi:6-aminohexanoate-dimer hydrolase, partial [Brucella melitensis]|nr:6-aminohexanoate-dimer hydrolase [Brucella melitensis]
MKRLFRFALYLCVALIIFAGAGTVIFWKK